LLHHYSQGAKARLFTDASGYAVAGVLEQLNKDDGQWYPVAFWSRKLQGPETRYETHDAELLAIVESFKHWRHYLEGSTAPITVLSDHANLRYFMTTKELSRRQARWAEKLAAYDFKIIYCPGLKNPADAPSRRPDYAPRPGEALENSLLPTLQNKLRVGLLAVEQRQSEKQKAIKLAGTQKMGPEVQGSSQEIVGRDKAAVAGEDRVAGVTEGPELLVPRYMVRAAMRPETAYSSEIAESMADLIRRVQKQDRYCQRVTTDLEVKGEPKGHE